MRYISLSNIYVSLGLAASFHNVLATGVVKRDNSDILINPPGFAPLPPPQPSGGGPRFSPQDVQPSLNLSNIQSDILVGMRKKQELFFFFQIKSPKDFKSKLRSKVFPFITSVTQIQDLSTSGNNSATLGNNSALVNIAFSHAGLSALGVPELAPANDPFTVGQKSLAVSTLGDPNTNNWVPAFTQPSTLHGVFVIFSDTQARINSQLSRIQQSLGNSISEVYRLQAAARPGNEQGHEHFGFKDGISNPGVEGFTINPSKGQRVVPAGIIFVGEDTDNFASWGKDGSFLAFRQLKQLVPEFNKFLLDNPVNSTGLSRAAASELTGARMFGRWKSGAPIELAPLADNLTIANDANLNNNFDFTLSPNNSLCPFSGHIRKTNPRSDLPNTAVDIHRFMRSGTPYGPEVTPKENASNKTSIERGLAFVSYQSNITNGFNFVQQFWANNPGFLTHTGFPQPGFDPIIGANQGKPRTVTGIDLANQTSSLTLLTDFIQSRGGEYFFTPSISAILDTITA